MIKRTIKCQLDRTTRYYQVYGWEGQEDGEEFFHFVLVDGKSGKLIDQIDELTEERGFAWAFRTAQADARERFTWQMTIKLEPEVEGAMHD